MFLVVPALFPPLYPSSMAKHEGACVHTVLVLSQRDVPALLSMQLHRHRQEG